jgi:ABC-type transport system involved in multi-copper enzyme maturation permease subunit
VLSRGNSSAMALILFVIFVVFFQFIFFFEKQIVNQPALRRVSIDFEHCPIMLNVLSYDKSFHNVSAHN